MATEVTGEPNQPLAGEPQGGTPQEGQTVVEQPGGETPPGAAPAAGQDKSYDALQAELAKVNQRLASVTGSVRRQHELESLILRSNSLQEAILEHLTNPDADPAVLAQKTQAIKQQGADAIATSRQQQIVNGYSAGITNAIKQVGLQPTDPRLQEAASLWSTAEQSHDLTDYHAAFLEVHNVVNAARDEQAKKKVEQETAAARQRYNQENDTLNLGTPGGMPASPASLSAYVQRLRKGDALPSAEEIDRLTAAYTRGS